MSAPAVAVTGMGAVAASGIGHEDVGRAAAAGTCAVDTLRTFDVDGYPHRLVGQLADFDAAEHFDSRVLTQTDRVTRFALLASDLALRDAALDPSTLDPERIGVSTANATGGFEFTHREMAKLWTLGPDTVSVYQSFAWFYAVNTGQISIRHGIKGSSTVLSGEQAGGLDAIGQARRGIGRGLDVVVAGGVESSFDPWGWVSHCASGRVTRAEDPARGYRPFDAGADGHAPGEGGALLVLESADHLAGRGGRAHGWITGYAAAFDPPGAPDDGLERVVRRALAQAGCTPADVDVVLADGAAVPTLDALEARDLGRVFGPYGVPVTVPKAGVGRLMSGAGPLDVVYALLAMRDRTLPPTPTVTDVPDHLALDLVLEPRPLAVTRALVVARGVEGFCSALVVERARPVLSTEPQE